MWRIMKRPNIFSDPKNLNTKNSFIIKRKFYLTNKRVAVMFCNMELHILGLCPVNILDKDKNNFPVGDRCL